MLAVLEAGKGCANAASRAKRTGMRRWKAQKSEIRNPSFPNKENSKEPWRFGVAYFGLAVQA
jgi:hypothetical protein